LNESDLPAFGNIAWTKVTRLILGKSRSGSLYLIRLQERLKALEHPLKKSSSLNRN
jgi:hypothetical protein